jgi:energy-coupling factor transporter ATP-binding protein EcfA2
VSYTYPNAVEPALDGVDLEIERGTLVGICGPSGGGKSTLLLQVMGLLRPTGGQVLCDDWGGLPIPADASPEVREDLQRRSIASDMERLLMAVLLHSQTPVVWIGVAESPDGTADVLEFVTPDDEATRLLVDTKTRMPLMMSWTGVAPQFGNRGGNNRGGGGGRGGQPQGGQQGGGQQGGRGRGQANAPTTITMYLSDYKTVNGMKLPHLLQRGPNGETTEEYAIKSYKVNQSFKADLFKTTK